MLSSTVVGLLAATAAPWVFGSEPDPAAFREGAALWQAGKGIERTIAEDRAVLARWFDGRIRRAADVCVWVSPKMVSRRLGYLWASRRWPMEEVLRRWRRAREELDGNLAFAVRLCALPKKGWDGEDAAPGDPRRVEAVRWLLTSGPGTPERRPNPVAPPWEPAQVPRYRAARSAEWPFQTTPEPIRPSWKASFRAPGEALQIDPLAVAPAWLEVEPPAKPSLLGGSHVALFWIQVPVDGLRLHPEGFELRLIVEDRERVGAWRFSAVGAR
ncbi:MAG: hypothetical protein N2109_06090 [Fimbriimonadales bacterium]|nr:hypothetical protein [Fimbriimonadales bacterium]